MGWAQKDNTETTIPRYNFMFFYVFKMAVAIVSLCVTEKIENFVSNKKKTFEIQRLGV